MTGEAAADSFRRVYTAGPLQIALAKIYLSRAIYLLDARRFRVHFIAFPAKLPGCQWLARVKFSH